MTILRSRDNPRVRRWARLASERAERRRERRAVAEGPHLVGAALSHGWPLEALVVSESGLARPEIAALVAAAGLEPTVLADRVFRSTFEVATPQGIAAELATDARANADANRQQAGPWVFLEHVQDPGNVGTIVRSAAAFGAAAVVLDAGCADPWSPKALRSGMGGHFGVSIVQCAAPRWPSLEAALREFQRDHGGTVLAAESRGATPLYEAALEGRIGWVFGSEGRGLSETVRALAAASVAIPVAGKTESLNVAAAAAICLYETSRRLART